MKLKNNFTKWLFLLAFGLTLGSCSKSDDITTIYNYAPCDDPTTPYPIVAIGTQVWMQKNLNVCKYRNGDDIPQVQDIVAWARLTTGAWCYYINDTGNGAVYGKLYNWYAVNDPRGLAPVGYHIPTDAEWSSVITFLGGELVAGSKMKATTGWTYFTGITNTNSSGFSSLPGGFRDRGGTFSNIDYTAYWWSSSQNASTSAWNRNLSYGYINAYRNYNYKTFGYAVRCVKD